jgi:hypothetical protein
LEISWEEATWEMRPNRDGNVKVNLREIKHEVGEWVELA